MLVYNYTNPQDLIAVKAMDIGTISNDNRVYIISYYAEPVKYCRYLPTIQRMIDSFEIINSSTTTTTTITTRLNNSTMQITML